jgi:hypothetical protein
MDPNWWNLSEKVSEEEHNLLTKSFSDDEIKYLYSQWKKKKHCSRTRSYTD